MTSYFLGGKGIGRNVGTGLPNLCCIEVKKSKKNHWLTRINDKAVAKNLNWYVISIYDSTCSLHWDYVAETEYIFLIYFQLFVFINRVPCSLLPTI